jgi:hypothetical protein
MIIFFRVNCCNSSKKSQFFLGLLAKLYLNNHNSVPGNVVNAVHHARAINREIRLAQVSDSILSHFFSSRN